MATKSLITLVFLVLASALNAADVAYKYDPTTKLGWDYLNSRIDSTGLGLDGNLAGVSTLNEALNAIDDLSGSFGEGSLGTLTTNQNLWDGSNATQTLVARLSGTNDPSFVFSDGLVNLSVGNFQISGSNVLTVASAGSAATLSGFTGNLTGITTIQGFADAFDTFSAGGTGTVTSVGLSGPSIFTITGSPVTTSGAIDIALGVQSANTIWAGPTTGSATPTFRALVDSDIPAAIARDSEVAAAYQPLDADLTSLAAAGNSATLVATTASFLTADETKLDGIEAGATADQTDSEIETAYNNQVSIVSQAVAEAGTSTTVFRWTPQRVAQAIAALGGGGTAASISFSPTGNIAATDVQAALAEVDTEKQPANTNLDDLADGSLTGTKVGFADTDANFAATDVQSAIEELDNVNGSGPNAADGKVSWSQLVDVPAGFADGSDDGAGGGGGTLNTIQEDGVAVGDPDIVTLNFDTGFDLVESPNTKITISMDPLEMETPLEAVLDLQDLQGAVTDGQVPDSITITLAGTATALATARTIGGVSFDGTANIVPQTIQVVDSTDATSSVAIFDSATGNLQPKTDSGITYDATTGTLSATAVQSGGTAVLVAGGVDISSDTNLTGDSEIVLTGDALSIASGITRDSELDAVGTRAGVITATGFNGNLATTDDTLQEVAQKVDDLTFSGSFGETSLAGLVNNQTLWNSASASRTLTFGLSGASDPVLTASNGVLNLSTGTLQEAGSPVLAQGDLGANVLTWLGTPSSSNLASAVTGETGSGALVFGTSPTIATPTISGAIAFPDGTRQTFNPDATNAGLNVGSQAGDPSTPSNGDLWYDSTANELTARINGSNVALGSGGGSGDVTAASAFGTDNVLIKSDGTGKGVQPTGITVDDTDAMTVPTVNATTFAIEDSDQSNTYTFTPGNLSANATITLGAGDITLPAGTLVADTRTVTVAGTTNEISSSAGAQDLSANRTWTLSLPATIDLGGKTSLEIPNGAAPTVDAFGEIAGDNNLWAASRGAPVFYDGTAAVALVGTLVSDTPANGQVPKWNTGGTITWEDDSTGTGFGETSLSTLANNQTLWDSASASRTLTFGLSGATDPVFTASNGVVNLSTGELQQGGSPVVLDSDIGSTVQAFDADLTALAALTGTNNIYYRSAADTWSSVTIGSGLTFSTGTLSATGGGFDSTTIDSTTWSDGANASNTWTFDVSGTVDPMLIFSDNMIATNAQLSAVGLTNDTGSLLFSGFGNTNNEDLIFDFETTANTVGVSSTSGVTSVNFGSIGLTANLTGNASTATTLQTTRTIGGSNFDGSANVTSFPSPGAIGGTTPAAGTFTTLTAGSTTSLLLGTAGSAVGNIGFRNATSGTATLAPPTGALGTYTVTLPNGTSTLPIATQQITFSGPTAARTYTLPDAATTIAGIATTQTLTNKTIAMGSNTITGSSANLRTALSDEVGSGAAVFLGGETDTWIIACSDETTDLTTGTAKVKFLVPYAATITAIEASVSTAPTGSSLVVDVNEAGTTLMSTNKCTIETGETSTLTATTPPGETDTSLAQWAELSVDIDSVGSTTPGKGLKVYISHTH